MKRILLTILQVSITVGLLCYIFRKPDQRAQMVVALHTANFFWLIPAIFSIGFAFALQTERWRLLLGVQGIRLGWWRTFKIYLIGAFFNLFLLGATGGDLVKIFYAMRETASKKSAAFLSVLVDRMMGLVALVGVTAVLCSLRLNVLLSHPEIYKYLIFLAVILGGSFAMVVFGFIVDRFHLAKFLPTWLPMHGKILELAGAFSVYARDVKVLALTFGISIPAHLLIFLAFFFAAQAFNAFTGLKGFLDFFSVIPIIQTISSVPISFGGLGLREFMFTTLLGVYPTELNLDVAPMISLIGYLILVLWGVLGGIVYLIYRPAGGIHIHDVEEEVAELEHAIEEKVEKEG
ncbi:lysylphosphatidylglycerol synthase transmembrane domain-containing protein [soil metagenome]